jgi:hypothetical protein
LGVPGAPAPYVLFNPTPARWRGRNADTRFSFAKKDPVSGNTNDDDDNAASRKNAVKDIAAQVAPFFQELNGKTSDLSR